MRAYIDASDKCSVLVAALTKDGKLVNGWRPQLSEVPAEFEEILLPKTPVKWDWSTASGPFDLYVLFLAPGSKEIEEAKKLIDAMQNPKIDDRILARGRPTGQSKRGAPIPFVHHPIGHQVVVLTMIEYRELKHLRILNGAAHQLVVLNAVPVVRDGEVVVRNIMHVTMSCDHRVVDGATGAKFLQTFKQMLEQPGMMLV